VERPSLLDRISRLMRSIIFAFNDRELTRR